jgi:hypothetical protein
MVVKKMKYYHFVLFIKLSAVFNGKDDDFKGYEYLKDEK